MKKNDSLILAILLFISFILLAIVDFRRGFIFPDEQYLFRSPFIFFSPWQILLIIVGAIGLKITAASLNLISKRENKKILIGILVLLVLDFVIYRGVAANKSLQAGKVGLDWLNAFGETGVMKPLFMSLSYLLTVWHATFLSCLLGGWGALAFPYMTNYLYNQSQFRAGFLGTLFSFTQPLCSCCVALTSPALLNSSLPRSFAISVLIGAPMLNISTLILAGSLLPWPFSFVRILGGLLVTLTLSYTLNRFLNQDLQPSQICETPTNSTSENLITNWFKLSGRLILWLFPSIIVGVVLTSVMWQFWPQDFSNSWLSVAVVSVLGSLLMITTWSEIPLALQMIGHGLNGPAAAALIALPAVNLASLILIGKSTQQWRLTFLLGFSIMLISFSVGMFFVG